MQGANLPLSTKPEPGTVGRTNILKIKALLFATTLRATWAIRDLSVEIAHLRVLLYIEGIVHVSTNT